MDVRLAIEKMGRGEFVTKSYIPNELVKIMNIYIPQEDMDSLNINSGDYVFLIPDVRYNNEELLVCLKVISPEQVDGAMGNVIIHPFVARKLHETVGLGDVTILSIKPEYMSEANKLFNIGHLI